MVNYLFLVIIFLFMAIEVVSAYKFFRFKKIKLGIFSTVYFLITLILTLSYFSTRNVLTENELESIINGISEFNLFAILVMLLNIGMIVISTISYVKVMQWGRSNKVEKKKKKWWILKVNARDKISDINRQVITR